MTFVRPAAEKPSALGAVTGMVAGLGTITPASGFVGPLGAVAIGGIAGVACFFATQVLKRMGAAEPGGALSTALQANCARASSRSS